MTVPSLRVLITGGCGFIGSHVARRCVELGWKVDVIDDLSTGLAENAPAGAKLHVTDFGDTKNSTTRWLHAGIKQGKFDVVFHLAARARVSYSVEHPQETHEINVERTLNLIEACRVGKIRRFVFSSSSSVYGGAKLLPTSEEHPKFPKSPYALQKSVIEDYLRLYHDLYGLESVCLRYFNVFGPGQLGDSPYSTAIAAWLTAIGEHRPLRSDGDGEQTRDMCYVDNVVDANIAAALHPGSLGGMAINVACGETHSNNQILERLRARYPTIEIQHAPERPGDVKRTHADVRRMQRVLGVEPKVKLWDGLERTIAWHENRPDWKRDTSSEAAGTILATVEDT